MAIPNSTLNLMSCFLLIDLVLSQYCSQPDMLVELGTVLNVLNFLDVNSKRLLTSIALSFCHRLCIDNNFKLRGYTKEHLQQSFIMFLRLQIDSNLIDYHS